MLVKALGVTVLVLVGTTATALLYLAARSTELNGISMFFTTHANDHALAVQTAADYMSRGEAFKWGGGCPLVLSVPGPSLTPA